MYLYRNIYTFIHRHEFWDRKYYFPSSGSVLMHTEDHIYMNRSIYGLCNKYIKDTYEE